jgi:DNA primase small subunit
MSLTDDQRKALVSFLEIVKGGRDQGKKVNVRGNSGDGELHPSIA